MEAIPLVARVWDYGWLRRDFVQLAPGSSDSALIKQYLASSAFQTSFIPNDHNETGIHGPFVGEHIRADDYVQLLEPDLEHYLESVQLSEVPGVDVAEQAKLLPHLCGAFLGGQRCYFLRRDERDKELFHEWGFVLWIFREFLFVGPRCDGFDRFVIGFD